MLPILSRGGVTSSCTPSMMTLFAMITVICAGSLFIAAKHDQTAATHAVVPVDDGVIRGVNIGGWLVLEPWITPSLFAPFANTSTPAVDEYTLSQILGTVEASRQLTAHWDSFLTYTDLVTLRRAGITHVRIPVGYWIISILPSEPYVSGGFAYLERALGWCRDIGLKVLVDVHGLPGSQNGQDNSGRRGATRWPEVDTATGRQLYIERSLAILDELTRRLQPWYFTSSSSPFTGPVTAIAIINEPGDLVPFAVTLEFYRTAYGVLRNATKSIVDVVIGDAYRLDQWSTAMQPPEFNDVVLDTHIYHWFDPELLAMNGVQHLNYSCEVFGAQEVDASKSMRLITGEWCLATNDCVPWLNGVNNGARYDGSFNSSAKYGSCTGDAGSDFSQFTPEYIAFLRTFAEVQMDSFEIATKDRKGGWELSIAVAAVVIHRWVSARLYSESSHVANAHMRE